MSHNQRISSQKQQKRQSLGRIYTTKREALSQIIHYPKSVLIDPYFLDHSHIKSKISSCHKQKKQKVIKFIGDQQQNIAQIILQMDSLIESQNRIFMQKQRLSVEKELIQILKIFYCKIDKLRSEREGYKEAYAKEKDEKRRRESEMEKEVERLIGEVMSLRKEKETLVENYQNQKKKRLFYERECMMLQERSKANNTSHLNMNNQTNAESYDDIVNRSTNDNFAFGDSLLIDRHLSFSKNHPHRHENHLRFPSDLLYSDENQPSINNYPPLNKNLQKSIKKKNNFTQQSESETNLMETETQENGNNKITHEEKQKLQSLLKKHNLGPHQLEGIIEEYLKNLKEQYEKQFENEEEMRLYLLAKKMDMRIWNKKVKKDIQKIISSKESTKMKG